MKLQLPFVLMTLLLAACATHPTAPTPPTDQATVSTPKPYQLPATETFSLTSKETGSTYNIVVGLPNTYGDHKANRYYPVLYVLDAQWQFPLFYTTAGAVNHDGDMPQALLVGISWQAENGRLMTLRNQDLTPTAIASAPGSGNSAKFQAFLRNELFPYIATHYRATQHRTVTGGSTSALFVFHSLLSQPDLFDGYIGTSPTVYWDNFALFRTLSNFPADGFHSQKRAYVCWGGLEPGRDNWNFSQQIMAKKFNNLEFRGTQVENAGHAGVNAECYNKGLQFVYAKPDIQLPDGVLKRYTGTYKNTQTHYVATISLRDNKLYITYQDNTELQLSAEKEGTFYARGNDLVLNFKTDAKHRVTAMTATHQNTTQAFTPAK